MIHHVFANRKNSGDWLAARGIQSLIAPFTVMEHLCDEAFVDLTLQRLSAAKSDDLIIIGGGGLFMDYFARFWTGFAEIGQRVPFCIWGVGYCDLKREVSHPPLALLRGIVRASRFCVVRDELTRGYLSQCALEPPVPCPSIVAVERPTSSGSGLLHVDNYIPVGADVYGAMTAYGIEFARHTGRPYMSTNNRIQRDSEASLRTNLRLYAAADLVLSSRLHGCIIGLAMGRKVLAVSGDRKLESFMEAAGLSDWVCDLDNISSLPKLLTSLPDQRTPWEFLGRVLRDNQRIADRVRADIEASNSPAAFPPSLHRTNLWPRW